MSTIKISKSQWRAIGRQAGWMKRKAEDGRLQPGDPLYDVMRSGRSDDDDRLVDTLLSGRNPTMQQWIDRSPGLKNKALTTEQMQKIREILR